MIISYRSVITDTEHLTEDRHISKTQGGKLQTQAKLVRFLQNLRLSEQLQHSKTMHQKPPKY